MRPAADLGGAVFHDAPIEARGELDRVERGHALREVLTDAREPKRADRRVLGARGWPPEESVGVERARVREDRLVRMTLANAHAYEPVLRNSESVELQVRRRAPVAT